MAMYLTIKSTLDHPGDVIEYGEFLKSNFSGTTELNGKTVEIVDSMYPGGYLVKHEDKIYKVGWSADASRR